MTLAAGDIDVCIVAYANEATISDCINSLSRVDAGVRVALCDNHPDGGTVSVATAAAERAGLALRSIHQPDNPGFGASCNALASGSSAAWLLFLNPDASVESWPGTLGRSPGITGPWTLQPDGRRQRNYGRRRSILDEISRRLQIRPREPAGTGYVSGAAMLIRRDEFERVGGFDDRFFMYYEDIDLCRRVVEAGGEVNIEESFVVRHIGAHSASSDPAAAAKRSYRSARAYHEKWTGSTRRIDLVVLIDSAIRVGLSHLRLPIPGAIGAQATLRESWRHLRGQRPSDSR